MIRKVFMYYCYEESGSHFLSNISSWKMAGIPIVRLIFEVANLILLF